MQDGVIKKNLSRRFKIKTVFGQDDPRCMEEVIIRRLKHSIENPKGGFGELPDVIFADGGITQIRAVQNAIQKVNQNLEHDFCDDFGDGGKNHNVDNNSPNKKIAIKVFGMVKNDKHQTRALMDDQRKELKISQNLMNLITRFQDTVHDTAITYHRKLRDKQITKSELDEINGIGEAKKQALLKHFGSVEKIKTATVVELMQVRGISKDLAEKVAGLGQAQHDHFC